MATTRNKPVTPKAKPAEIRITIGEFTDVLGTGKPITDFSLALAKRNPNVSVDGDTIHVKYPKTTVRFTLASSAGDKINFYPAGITFVLKSDCATTEASRLGLQNFPQNKIRLDGESLSITDNYLHVKNTITYKFSLVVQRGSDGKIGIIDPGISNNNANPR